MQSQSVVILGSTGSIGKNTLDVIGRHPESLSVYALSAHTRIKALAKQAARFLPKIIIVPTDQARDKFIQYWAATAHPLPVIRVGAQALIDTVQEQEVTTVMAAIVGIAGLPSVLAAAQAGKRILLANKEALVAAGDLFMRAVAENQAELLPVDSEHNAIFQCLPERQRHNGAAHPAAGVRRLLLTASGGPFRTYPLAALDTVTPEQACAHPTWQMGRKISVDSATMLNKGLEVIEAHWLFAMPAEKIDVVIHPQSVVHSMVEYEDGSVLAHMGQPDMRTPIAHSLGFPHRIESGVGLMSLTQMGTLEFEAPDYQRFPCLKLAYEALAAGQTACIGLNAANEEQGAAFLQGKLRYIDIARVIAVTLEEVSKPTGQQPESLEHILELDQYARITARQQCQALYT